MGSRLSRAKVRFHIVLVLAVSTALVIAEQFHSLFIVNKIRSADFEGAAQRAWREKDCRLLRPSLGEWEIPGLPWGGWYYESRFGTRDVPFKLGIFNWYFQRDFKLAAIDYASRYNQTLLLCISGYLPGKDREFKQQLENLGAYVGVVNGQITAARIELRHLSNRELLDELRTLGSLEILEFFALSAQGKPAELEVLSGLSQITSLELDDCAVDESQFKTLTLQKLQVLSLSRVRLTDNCLKIVGNLNNLKRLNLTGASISDEALEYLRHLPLLEVVSLMNTQTTDRGLEPIGKIRSLRELNLSPNVTDSGLEYLKQLENLRYLSVRFSKVTELGTQELKRRLPNLQVLW